jgi:hypothetical protein
MKQQLTLTITSLLSILLFSLHWADEVSRGIEKGDLSAVGGLVILAVWLYGTLGLSGKRLGLIIILLGSILASGVPVLHMSGKGLVGGRIAPNSDGAFFWVWTLIVLAPIGFVSLLLSIRALWNVWRSPAQKNSASIRNPI